jgi:hypothetical protein
VLAQRHHRRTTRVAGAWALDTGPRTMEPSTRLPHPGCLLTWHSRRLAFPGSP